MGVNEWKKNLNNQLKFLTIEFIHGNMYLELKQSKKNKEGVC